MARSSLATSLVICVAQALFGWLLATTLGVYLRVANLVDAPFHSGLGIRGNYYQHLGPDLSEAAPRCTFSYWLFLLGPMGLMAGLMVSPYLPRSESVCFLDLACIHAESSLKRRGINNIGGCLAVSQELRVLYHPSNFTSNLAWISHTLVAEASGACSSSQPSARLTQVVPSP